MPRADAPYPEVQKAYQKARQALEEARSNGSCTLELEDRATKLKRRCMAL